MSGPDPTSDSGHHPVARRRPSERTLRVLAAIILLSAMVVMTAPEPHAEPAGTAGEAASEDRDGAFDEQWTDPDLSEGFDHRVLEPPPGSALRRPAARIPFVGADAPGKQGGAGADQVRPTRSEPVPVPAGWRLVWSDEFEAAALDTSVWRPYHSTYGDGNRELQCHTPDNVEVAEGRLRITARREPVTCPGGVARQFSSGFLGTREQGVYFPRFARYEIRARIPHGQGLWPAFWLRHRDGAIVAEVDVMEYFHAQVPGRTSTTLHLDGQVNASQATAFFEEPTASGGWHVWAVQIDEHAEGVEFEFSLNGEVVHTYLDTQAQWASGYPGEPLFDIAVNLSVGGDWAGHPDDPLGYLGQLDRCAKWQDPGPPPHGCDAEGVLRATFPAVYEVDYVRVYEREPS